MRKSGYVTVTLWAGMIGLLMVAVLTLYVKPTSATSAQCIRLLQPDQLIGFTEPYLSKETLIDPQRGPVSTTASPNGMSPDAYAPNKRYAVYWQPLDNTKSQPVPVGLFLTSRQIHKTTQLTALNSNYTYDMEMNWPNPNREQSSPYWRFNPKTKFLAYVGYLSPDAPDQPYLGIADMNGNLRAVNLNRLLERPIRIFIHGWSADGRYLAFSVEYRSPDQIQTLWVWKVGNAEKGVQPVPLTSAGAIGKVSWTPFDHQLIVLSNDEDKSLLSLWSPEQGIRSQVEVRLQYDYQIKLSWSPDGQHVVINDCSSHCYEAHQLIGVANNKLTLTTDKIHYNEFTDDNIWSTSYRIVAWLDNGDALIDFFDNALLTTSLVRLNMNKNVNQTIEQSIYSSQPAPDGKSTLIALRGDATWAVDVLESNGKRRQLLSVIDTSSNSFLSWSPDSRYAAIVTDMTTTFFSVKGDEQWAPQTIPARDFIWLDGGWAFIAVPDINKSDVLHMWLMNLSTGQMHEAGQSTADAPIPAAVISPDGKKIAYRSAKNTLSVVLLATGKTQTFTANRLWIASDLDAYADNGVSRSIYYDRYREWLPRRISWSPDSSQIAFFMIDDANKASLYVAPAEELATAKVLYSTEALSSVDVDYILSWIDCTDSLNH